MRFGLKEIVVEQINALCQQYTGIEQVIIYGSRAKGNYKPGSDIDLTIVGDIDFSTLLNLEDAIDELMLPYMIDLSIMKKIENPALIDHIQRVGQVFYQKQDKISNNLASLTQEEMQTTDI